MKDMLPAEAQRALWLLWAVGDGETRLDQIVEVMNEQLRGA